MYYFKICTNKQLLMNNYQSVFRIGYHNYKPPYRLSSYSLSCMRYLVGYKTDYQLDFRVNYYTSYQINIGYHNCIGYIIYVIAHIFIKITIIGYHTVLVIIII